MQTQEERVLRAMERAVREELRPKFWWEPYVSSIVYWVGIAISFLVLIWIGNGIFKIITKIFN